MRDFRFGSESRSRRALAGVHPVGNRLQPIPRSLPPFDIITVAAVQHGVDDPGIQLVLVLRQPSALVEDDAHAGKQQWIHRQRLKPVMLLQVCDQIFA